MLTLIAAAAVAAAHPGAAPANAQGQMPMMQMNMGSEHDAMKGGMDCCKDCCKDKHDGESADHATHSQQ